MIAQTEPQPEPDLGVHKAGNAEALAGYREALKNLARAMEAAKTLAEKTAGLEQRLTQLQSEYATLLDTDDSVDSLKKESALSPRSGFWKPNFPGPRSAKPRLKEASRT